MSADPALWQRRRVLVTGAGGLLGGWLVQALADAGASVVCLLRDAVPNSYLVLSGLDRRVTLCWGDVAEQETLERVVSEYEIATVFHLAAQTIVPIAYRNPVATFESNIRGTWALLEACRRVGGVSEIVIASSDKAYGSTADLPYREDAPLQGTSPYDVSKSCADLIGQSYAHTWGLPVGITRCGNFFGGGDLNMSRLVPTIITSFLRGDPPVIRSDGKHVRDYIYAEDGAAAYLKLAEEMRDRPELAGRAYNFSLEQPKTVLEMVDVIASVMGVSIEPVILDEAKHEIRAQYLDATRARTELGWAPAVGLEEGLRRTVDWYRTHLSS